MVELYVSWCKGLPDDKKALKILRDSKIIDGIETADAREVKKIQESGLKASIHRPFRGKNGDLEYKNFKDNFWKKPLIMRGIRKSQAPTVGFHLMDYYLKNKEKSIEEAMSNAMINLKALSKKFDKKIVFETIAYRDPLIRNRGSNFSDYTTSPDAIKRLIQSEAGFLFDVSHHYISYMNKKEEGLYNRTVEDYFKEIIKSSEGKIYQIHLNVPDKNGDFKKDPHGIFEHDSPIEEEILKLTKYVIENSPKLEALTLEMNSKLSSKGHAEEMVNQAKFIKEHLGI